MVGNLNIRADTLEASNQVLCDITNQSEWFLHFSRNTLVCLDQGLVVLNLFVHHVECCHVLNDNHCAFLAHVGSLLLFDRDYFLAILFLKVGLVQVDLIGLRVPECRVLNDLCQTELFSWHNIAFNVFKRDENKRLQNLSCQLSWVIDVWYFDQLAKKIQKFLVRELD